MSQNIALQTQDGLTLYLTRYAVAKPKASVLLIHGASASSVTFTTPNQGHLVAYLTAEQFDVWTLDWRGSNLIAGRPGNPTVKYFIDSAAMYDVPAACQMVKQVMQSEQRGGQSFGVLGHCVGGGVLAAAISNGHLLNAAMSPSAVVLSALGLFYSSPWDGWAKGQDYVIERVMAEAQAKGSLQAGATVDITTPNASFPPPMDDAYRVWPRTLLEWCGCGVEACHQVTFMFGHPYIEQNLAAGIHDNKTLETLFNHMPLDLYLQCGQNLRRGVYAAIDADEDLRALHPAQKPSSAHFNGVRVTLLSGEDNRLWHRESIDRMYEWLRSNGHRDTVKHVLRGFAHQDLYWGRTAWTEVFPKIAAGLFP